MKHCETCDCEAQNRLKKLINAANEANFGKYWYLFNIKELLKDNNQNFLRKIKEVK